MRDPTTRGSPLSEYGYTAPAKQAIAVSESAAWLRVGRRVVLCGVAAAAYYGAARFGYALNFAGPVAAIVWLPVGVGISFLYLGGLGLWPGLVVGDLLANDYSTLPIGSAIGQTCGNLLEVIVAVVLIRRLVPGGSPLDRVGGVARLVASMAVGTAVSATVGTTSLALGGVLDGSSLPAVWRTWWLGDFSGALLVVPLVLAWQPWRLRSERVRAGVLEAALILVAVAAASEIVFRSDRPLVYLAFPVLTLAALRLGERGVTLALLVSASIGVWNTTHSVGPFHFRSITETVVGLQLYLAVASLSMLLLAAVVFERERIARTLGQIQLASMQAASMERHQLEQHLHNGAQNRLVALCVRVANARQRAYGTPAWPAELLREIEAELETLNHELRALAHGLHPLVVTSLGLADAVRSLAARSPIPIVLRDLPSVRLDPSVEEAAYLTIAEAVTNAQKYAQPRSISVQANVSEGTLSVVIADDGVGGAAERASAGLAGLRERAEALGGSFEVASISGAGTHVTATLPLPPSADGV